LLDSLLQEYFRFYKAELVWSKRNARSESNPVDENIG